MRYLSDTTLVECAFLYVPIVVISGNSTEWLSICSIFVVSSVGVCSAEVIAEVAVVLVCVDACLEGRSYKWYGCLAFLKLIAEGRDRDIIGDILDMDVVIAGRVFGVDRVASVGVSIRTSIGVMTIIGGLSTLICESEWCCGPISLSNLSLGSKGTICLIKAIVSVVWIIRQSDNCNFSIFASLKSNKVIIRMVNVDLDITVGVSEEATGFS